ncbi:MAG: twin-arginine translocase TatA/TatE family subunit [Planctomycetota bacterium]
MMLLAELDLTPTATLAIGMPSGWEWGIVLIVGVLLFGRRLPEIGHSIGKSIVEFKRGVRGVKDEIDREVAKDRAEQDKAPAEALPEGESSRTVARGKDLDEAPARGSEGANPAT